MPYLVRRDPISPSGMCTATEACSGWPSTSLYIAPTGTPQDLDRLQVLLQQRKLRHRMSGALETHPSTCPYRVMVFVPNWMVPTIWRYNNLKRSTPRAPNRLLHKAMIRSTPSPSFPVLSPFVHCYASVQLDRPVLSQCLPTKIIFQRAVPSMTQRKPVMLTMVLCAARLKV
jgi:hypothetical protein